MSKGYGDFLHLKCSTFVRKCGVNIFSQQQTIPNRKSQKANRCYNNTEILEWGFLITQLQSTRKKLFIIENHRFNTLWTNKL